MKKERDNEATWLANASAAIHSQVCHFFFRGSILRYDRECSLKAAQESHCIVRQSTALAYYCCLHSSTYSDRCVEQKFNSIVCGSGW